MRCRFQISLLLLLSSSMCGAQVVCLATVEQAIAGRGAPSVNGFHVEAVIEDPLNGRRWAKVERCQHPEWPAVLVAAPGQKLASVPKARVGASALSDDLLFAGLNAQARMSIAAVTGVSERNVPAVRAGETVTVVERTASIRLEVPGTALNSAHFGEAARVRVRRMSSALPQVVTGVARGRALVELEEATVEQQ